jgi:hypothetical protein
LDKNNLLYILKTLTELMHCPTCGRAYTIEEVQYISQVEGYCLLQVTCKSCKVPVWVNFFVEKDQKVNSLERAIKRSSIETEITHDEIIEFHNVIGKFDGNFKKTFKRRLD